MAPTCWRFGISRQHGYRWFARWRVDGAASLADRSRAPLADPQAVPPCSRYLLRGQAVDSEHGWPIRDAAFREYGLSL